MTISDLLENAISEEKKLTKNQVRTLRELEAGVTYPKDERTGKSLLRRGMARVQVDRKGDDIWKITDKGKKALKGVVEHTMSEGYYSKPGNLREIIKRWQQDGDKIEDHAQPVAVPARALWPHREYTWTRKDARMTPAEWDELLRSVKKKGWSKKDPLHFQIGREGGSKVAEGNHRLAIAVELGLRDVPVQFHFVSGRVRKEPRRQATPQVAKRKRPQVPDKPRKDLSPEQQKKLDKDVKNIMDILGM